MDFSLSLGEAENDTENFSSTRKFELFVSLTEGQKNILVESARSPRLSLSPCSPRLSPCSPRLSPCSPRHSPTKPQSPSIVTPIIVTSPRVPSASPENLPDMKLLFNSGARGFLNFADEELGEGTITPTQHISPPSAHVQLLSPEKKDDKDEKKFLHRFRSPVTVSGHAVLKKAKSYRMISEHEQQEHRGKETRRKKKSQGVGM
jgi:hypothetical protein